MAKLTSGWPRASADQTAGRTRFHLQAFILFQVLTLAATVLAAPFTRQFSFMQPDGAWIQLWGHGDEFHAVFETLDGYTVLFVPEERAYDYAQLSEDGRILQSTGIRVGPAIRPPPGLEPHLRIAPDAARDLARHNFQAWDQRVRLSERWMKLKDQRAIDQRVVPLSRSLRPTLGVKCGLTLLVDFEDEPATIAREDIWEFLNGDSFSLYGNNGSVKQYFWDNSGGRLLFTNVVTAYVRIPNSLHPRSYYNDISRPAGERGILLVCDALALLKASSYYTNEILPALANLTLDSTKKVVSFNVFVAGESSGVWARGIWGHQGSLYPTTPQLLWPGGAQVSTYQLSPIGHQLELHTFCHENGHMLCNFPDLYDYDFDAYGGAGNYCIMGYGTTDTNPPQFCAYLKLAAGWAAAIDLQSETNFLAPLSASGPNASQFYRLKKPLQHTEYFLLENRQRTGHDTELPGAGIALWHIDELGNRDDQNLQTNGFHSNYEVTLVPADNLWHFSFLINEGDSSDLFYKDNPAAGYANCFSDYTAPCARWWDGTRSGLDLSDFSTNGNTMTFQACVQPVVFLRDPVDLTVFEGNPASFNCQIALPASSIRSIQWCKNGLPLEPSDRLTGAKTPDLRIPLTELSDAGSYTVILEHASGMATSRVAQLTVRPGPQWFMTNISCSGSARVLPDGFDLMSSGAGLKGSQDAFSWIYQTVAGDFDLQTRLFGLNVKSDATRAGLTVRSGFDRTNRHVSLLFGITYPTYPCTVLARLVEGGPTVELLSVPSAFEQPSLLSDYWMRIKREGSVFSFYHSTNGSDWISLKSATIELDTTVGAGLIAASTFEATTAMFRSCQISYRTPSTLAIFPQDNIAHEGTLDTARVAVYASCNGPLEAGVLWAGSATWGVDYAPVLGKIVIPSGTNVGTLLIAPINDAQAEPPETVEIALDHAPGFSLVEPASATILIQDDEQTSGGLIRQQYSSVGGYLVQNLTHQMTNPNARKQVGFITSFETPQNTQDNYGQVLTGYLVPPESGEYQFYLASDDNSELWLSSDQDPEHARRIAQVQGVARYRHYLNSGNHSEPIYLEQGSYYYVKALHKERIDDDCFSVAWQKPNGSPPADLSDPIDASCLAFSVPIDNKPHLDPPAAWFPPQASTGIVHVICQESWTAWSPDSWITVIDTAPQNGNGTVAYSIQANNSQGRRVGTIVINDCTHSIVQHSVPHLKFAIHPNQSPLLTAINANGYRLILETSEDLISWRPIHTNWSLLDLDPQSILPMDSNRPVQFYRVLAQ